MVFCAITNLIIMKMRLILWLAVFAASHSMMVPVQAHCLQNVCEGRDVSISSSYNEFSVSHKHMLNVADACLLDKVPLFSSNTFYNNRAENRAVGGRALRFSSTTLNSHNPAFIDLPGYSFSILHALGISSMQLFHCQFKSKETALSVSNITTTVMVNYSQEMYRSSSLWLLRVYTLLRKLRL